MNFKNKTLRRQPKQERSQERVERILDAAAIVFEEIGFEAATTHEIAARANTAVGSLYQFFSDKLAIFNALELRHIERVHLMWERLSRSEIIQLPFVDFIHTLVSQIEQLFANPTSRIVFIQFFTSPTIFKNIDASFTQEVIEFTAELFRKRNPKLEESRSKILAEIAVNASNTLILIALRTDEVKARKIVMEIEDLLEAYLKNDLGDKTIKDDLPNPVEIIAKKYKLNHRQKLILKYLDNHPHIAISNCETIFPSISRRTLQRDLKAMNDKRLLFPNGNTDCRSYSLNSELDKS